MVRNCCDVVVLMVRDCCDVVVCRILFSKVQLL